jgi:hypothetical protein
MTRADSHLVVSLVLRTLLSTVLSAALTVHLSRRVVDLEDRCTAAGAQLRGVDHIDRCRVD